MKIRGWFIESFGIFREYRSPDLSAGLTVFHGPNGAGKSTTVAFLRGVLFGFPDHRSREPLYRPLRGGRQGGRVLLLGPDGEYVIEREVNRRTAPRVTLPGQRQGSEDDLRRLLGDADAHLFRSVFAFSLSELQSLASLDAGAVRDRLFSAAIAGAGRSASEALGKLHTEALSLLKPRGQSRANGAARTLVELRTRIAAAQTAAARYAETLHEKDRWQAEVDRFAESAARLRDEKDRYESLIELRPLWDDLAVAQRELDGLEPIDHFPEDPEDRLARALTAVDTAKQTVDQLAAAQEAARAQRDELVLDDAAAVAWAEVESLHEALAVHREQLEQLRAARGELKRAGDLLRESLARLGPDWDTERLVAFDRSIPNHEDVSAWGQRLEEAERASEGAQHELDVATARREELLGIRDSIAARLAGPEPPPAANLDAEEHALRRVHSLLVDRRAEDAETKSLEVIIGERSRIIAARSKAPWSPSPWLDVTGCGLGALTLGGAIWRVAHGDAVTSVVLAALAMLSAVAVVGVGRLRAERRTSREWRRSRLAVLRSELEYAAQGLGAHQQKARQLGTELAKYSSQLAPPPVASAEDVEAREELLSHQRQQRREWDSAVAELNEAETRLDAAAQLAEIRRTALLMAHEHQKQTIANWTLWKRTVGIADGLTPPAVVEFFATVQTATMALHKAEETRPRLSQLETEVSAWEARALSALAVANVHRASPAGGDALVDDVLGLHARCQRDQERRASRTLLEAQLRERSSEITAAERRLRERELEKDQLFIDGGAADEEGFRAKLATYRRRLALQKIIQDQQRQLVGRIGDGPSADAFLADLSTGQIDQWCQRAAAIDGDVVTLERSRDEAIRKHRDLEAACQLVEESTEIPRLEVEVADLIAEQHRTVREGRILALAQGLIEETRREFERSRQPAVLSHASKAFAAVTSSHYEGVVQTRKGLAVLDRQRTRRRVEELSRGTAEQLYVCLRLGLISDFALRNTSLPLVMDDVLANFDPGRARAMAEGLVDFARDHQILVFTCHPETRDLFQQIDDSVAVVEMDRIHTDDLVGLTRKR
jgi:uncharacterized protein YhaN